jgi:hypothetical protein
MLSHISLELYSSNLFTCSCLDAYLTPDTVLNAIQAFIITLLQWDHKEVGLHVDLCETGDAA